MPDAIDFGHCDGPRSVPAMGHAFDWETACVCGTTWLEHQAFPEPCDQADKARHARFKSDQAVRVRRRRASHCKHGHELNEENTYTYPDGSRRCRPCKLALDQGRRDKLRAERKRP